VNVRKCVDISYAGKGGRNFRGIAGYDIRVLGPDLIQPSVVFDHGEVQDLRRTVGSGQEGCHLSRDEDLSGSFSRNQPPSALRGLDHQVPEIHRSAFAHHHEYGLMGLSATSSARS